MNASRARPRSVGNADLLFTACFNSLPLQGGGPRDLKGCFHL